MDRLTIPDVKVDAHTTRRTMIDAEAVKERAMEIYWKLKKYEDTGLTPEEVLSMSAEWCAMMSVLNSIGSYDRLRELAEADKEGRVVVLPCKVGDTVYSMLDEIDAIHECEVVYINVAANPQRNMIALEPLSYRGRMYGAIFGAFGKTVFRTREEAEKALEEKLNGR